MGTGNGKAHKMREAGAVLQRHRGATSTGFAGELQSIKALDSVAQIIIRNQHAFFSQHDCQIFDYIVRFVSEGFGFFLLVAQRKGSKK